MPKLFPIIDAVPTWLIYTLVVMGLALTAGGIGALWEWIRYEWKYYQHHRREAAIAEERMQAQAERWQR